VLASAFIREFAGDITLSRAGKPPHFWELARRDFLLRSCQAVGVTFVPSKLWNSFVGPSSPVQNLSSHALFQLHPRYRRDRPLDATLLKVEPGRDRFITEKYAEEIGSILSAWSAGLLRSPQASRAIQQTLAPNFSGTSPQPITSRIVRSSSFLQVRQQKFGDARIAADAFLRDWLQNLQNFSRLDVAQFQITAIDAGIPHQQSKVPVKLQTHVRYEIVGTGAGFHREQRIGNWDLEWAPSQAGSFLLTAWKSLDETRAISASPVYIDIAASVFAGTRSYSEQMLHGVDYWRTVLDGACGIDIYGHNGVSVADINNDGWDDLYVCQPAGLPNRLYRNRGDGTFEDITQSSGLGILENTACALFADFNNDGYQHAILVRANGPLFFVNEGGGKFREQSHAFKFANPPQGTFTGASVADYDRDGWLDLYFCLYSYYQGTGQYRYPSPYHDAENGPPNFLMRNNRDGTFRDVTAPSGLDQNNTRYSFCCAWNDYNRDGWPDLYVVNDFGRKNLYRNNGDGTFTDVAPEVGAEDVGAGMSVSWLDYDNDGSDDLYVGNMWTAAGMRISMQDVFKKESPSGVRRLFQKHAMGNSLLHNRDAKFEEATKSAEVGIGRWAWTSDAFDFDHDGFPDLYITNGMVSGPAPADLNSFFWRQVVANSPNERDAAHDYEQGWNAINELIRADGTWSGYERNIFYANNRDGTFSDVSGAIGLDIIEDGRSFALADFDHDGRLELALKNRNAPQLRLLKNVVVDLPPAISFRLQGKKSNRDAVGAVITIESGSTRQTKTLQVGSGFLSQHSKDVFFGLGEQEADIQATIHWPSGLVQKFAALPINHRIWVEEGKDPSRIESLKRPLAQAAVAPPSPNAEELPTKVETWLLSPIIAPAFTLPDLKRTTQSLSALRGKNALLSFWTTQSPECIANLKALEIKHVTWAREGLQLLTLNVDDFVPPESGASKSPDLATFAREQRFSFPLLRASDEVTAVYNILYRQMFDRHRDLSLPTSFLIDHNGNIVKVYQGSLDLDHLERDFRSIPTTDAERLERGLPIFMPGATLDVGRNHLSLGSLFFQRGYLDQAEASFQQALQDDPSSAEALYGIGSVYLNQNKNAAARESFERCVKMQASYPDTLPDAWNNLGVLATREGHFAESVGYFQQALKLSPNHLLSLNNLGNAYRAQKQWTDARAVLERAVTVAPEDPEGNYSLGMVFAQTDDTTKAEEYLQRALKARPDYPEALNNLGVLYLVTKRAEEAVASFQNCIRVAPAFDQAYLNLARLYALQGSRDKARDILKELLNQHPDHPQARQMLEQLQQ
jgi:tetratricopeptide (TPR) repeat protein